MSQNNLSKCDQRFSFIHRRSCGENGGLFVYLFVIIYDSIYDKHKSYMFNNLHDIDNNNLLWYVCIILNFTKDYQAFIWNRMKSVQVTVMLTWDWCKIVSTNIPMICKSCVPYPRSTCLNFCFHCACFIQSTENQSYAHF